MRVVHWSNTGSTKRKVPIAIALIAIAGLASGMGVTAASGALQSHSTRSVVIATFKSAKLGTILSDGTTLYTLRPNATLCATTCRKYWIPVLLPKGVTRAKAGAGVNAAKLGAKSVAGGRQVTYGGKLLFWFFNDKVRGQVTGNVTDTWGRWSDVVLVKPTTPPTTTTTTPKSTTTTTPTATSTTVPRTTTTISVGGGGGF